jgi:hypothetical protein
LKCKLAASRWIIPSRTLRVVPTITLGSSAKYERRVSTIASKTAQLDDGGDHLLGRALGQAVDHGRASSINRPETFGKPLSLTWTGMRRAPMRSRSWRRRCSHFLKSPGSTDFPLFLGFRFAFSAMGERRAAARRSLSS